MLASSKQEATAARKNNENEGSTDLGLYGSGSLDVAKDFQMSAMTQDVDQCAPWNHGNNIIFCTYYYRISFVLDLMKLR